MAKYIEKAVMEYIAGASAVTAVTSVIYWMDIAPGATPPYIVGVYVSNPLRPLWMSNGINAGQLYIQVSCVTKTTTQGELLRDAVKDRLRWARGTIASQVINIIRIENMRARRDPETGWYVHDVDAIVEYIES